MSVCSSRCKLQKKQADVADIRADGYVSFRFLSGKPFVMESLLLLPAHRRRQLFCFKRL